MASAQAGVDLRRLAAQAREVPQVRQVLLSQDNWRHRAREAVGDGRRSSVPQRLGPVHGLPRPPLSRRARVLQSPLVRDAGLHSEAPVRLSRPDRYEGPAISRSVPADGSSCRSAAAGNCEIRVKRMIFDHLLHAARSGSVLRENFKNEGIRWTATLRRMLLEIGARLTDTGVLDGSGRCILPATVGVGGNVAGRRGFQCPPDHRRPAGRSMRRTNRSPRPKSWSGGSTPTSMSREPKTAYESADVLHGVAASAGVATGKARVILRADTDEQVQAGRDSRRPVHRSGLDTLFRAGGGDRDGAGRPALPRQHHRPRIRHPGRGQRPGGHQNYPDRPDAPGGRKSRRRYNTRVKTPCPH